MTNRVAGELPRGARWAALLFLLYGLVVVLAAALWPAADGWALAVLRGLLLVVIALGLWRVARWAWFLGVVFPGIWLLRGLLELGGASLAALSGDPSLPTRSLLVLAVAVAVLGLGWGMLLTRDVRRTYLGEGGSREASA